MAQTQKKQVRKKKPVRTTKRAAKKNVARRPAKPKTRPKQRVSSRASQQTRAPLKDKSLDAVSMQLQRIEKQVASMQTGHAERGKARPTDVDARLKTIERKFDARLGRLDERIDSLRAHLLDLEDRLEGETTGGSLHARDLDEGLDDS